ncbi:MAG: hypothetical protein ABI782_09765, partial [Anaerolineaceae bacterium]
MAEPYRSTVPRLPYGSGQSAIERSLAGGSLADSRGPDSPSPPTSAYVELHAHSCWSLREGASSSDEM